MNIAKNELIVNGKQKYSHNSSGIYFNLLIVSDENLIKIKELVDNNLVEIDNDKKIGSSILNYKSYSNDDKAEAIQGSNNGSRLSNQEKNILLKNNK